MPNRPSSDSVFIIVALAALIVFAFLPVVLFLLVFGLVVVFLLWDLHGRMTRLEKRLEEKEAAAGAQS
jgi:hypothetical protein